MPATGSAPSVIRGSAHFCNWPFATKIHVRSNVGNWGMIGLVMLIASFVDRDPLRTSRRSSRSSYASNSMPTLRRSYA
jgi:hypothetical protein